MEFLLFLP